MLALWRGARKHWSEQSTRIARERCCEKEASQVMNVDLPDQRNEEFHKVCNEEFCTCCWNLSMFLSVIVAIHSVHGKVWEDNFNLPKDQCHWFFLQRAVPKDQLSQLNLQICSPRTWPDQWVLVGGGPWTWTSLPRRHTCWEEVWTSRKSYHVTFLEERAFRSWASEYWEDCDGLCQRRSEAILSRSREGE